MRTRQWRRFQNERLKKNRQSYSSCAWWDDKGRRNGYLLNNPQTCSCYMCGNSRRYAKGEERFTIQERRSAQKGYHAVV